MQSSRRKPLAKYNYMHRYILSDMEVFSKYLNLVPVKSKSGPFKALSFRSLFHDNSRQRPEWLPTDMRKEFLNKLFQVMLRNEGNQFQVC